MCFGSAIFVIAAHSKRSQASSPVDIVSVKCNRNGRESNKNCVSHNVEHATTTTIFINKIQIDVTLCVGLGLYIWLCVFSQFVRAPSTYAQRHRLRPQSTHTHTITGASTHAHLNARAKCRLFGFVVNQRRCRVTPMQNFH